VQEKSKKILVVDDDRFAQKLVGRALSDKYELRFADDGDQGLMVASEWMPDAILLDVEMPGKTGYEVCEIIRRDPLIAKIPVVFLSGNSSLREKMLGFEVGADDYLVKPFEPELLRAKVSRIAEIFAEHKELDQKAKDVEGLVFQALTSSAELGKALRFVEHTYALHDFDELAQALFKVLGELGLVTSVAFLSREGACYYSSNSEEISPLEKDLLQLMHQQGRFIDFGCRTFVNYRQVSLLVKNMPLDNMERYGRVKDTIPFILGAVDGKVRSLDLHHTLLKHSENMSKSVDAIGTTLDELTQKVTAGQDQINDIVSFLLSDLDFHLPRLGLEPDQEKFIISKITSAFNDTISQMQQGLKVSDALQGVVRLLEHLAMQQQALIELNFAEQTRSDESSLPNDGDVYSSDIELF
jgi:DNA-binding response OmpR family regulator